MCDGSLPLLHEQIAVAVIGNPENCALVGIRSGWDRACERAGIEDLHIHDLRGRAGVDALGEDEDMRSAQRLLGHAGEGMTRHYVDGSTTRRQSRRVDATGRLAGIFARAEWPDRRESNPQPIA